MKRPHSIFTATLTTVVLLASIFVASAPANAATSSTVNYIPAGLKVNTSLGFGKSIAGQKFQLQTKLVGKAWRTSKTLKANSKGYVFFSYYSSPKKMASYTVKYRIIQHTSTHNSNFSISTIRYENPKAYTGVRKAYYDQIKQYCPYALLTVSNSQVAAHGDQVAGFFDPNNYRITVRSDLEDPKYLLWNTDAMDSELKMTLLHECGHMNQFLTYANQKYGDFDITGMNKTMNKIYGTTGNLNLGIEHNADCVAIVLGANADYSGYGSTTCITDAEQRAARAIIAHKRPTA